MKESKMWGNVAQNQKVLDFVKSPSTANMKDALLAAGILFVVDYAGTKLADGAISLAKKAFKKAKKEKKKEE